MHTSIDRLLRAGGLLVLTVALLATSAAGRAGRASAAPAAATLPAATCTLTGSTRSCDLWAKTGTISLPGLATTPAIWGYAASAADPAGLPGPTLIANQGETVAVTLHNTLPEASSLSFPGQALPPDTVGAPATTGTKTYTFVAGAPGTYLYEAGLTANGSRQVAMGLYGALIVRPATAGQAYASPSSAYNDEALLVLSEIDTNLNAAPSSFKMYNYNPNFWLINGKAFPNTAPIDTAAGNKVLLRYVNAGLQPRAVGLLGLRQTVLASDGDVLPYARTVIAETMGAGQTLDVVTAIPAGAAAGTKYALYNTNGQPRNASQRTSGVLNFGGMLTFLTVGTGAAPTDTAGPATSGVSIAPSPTNGTVNVTLAATVSDQSTGGANVSAAEYFVDAVGANTSGVAMTGAFGVPSVNVSATVSAATLAGLPSGSHTFYVHGRDSNGNWGPVSSAVLNLDKAGPAISAAALSPAYSNGTTNVGIQATASDTATGNGNVAAAEYFIGAPGANGSGTALTLNQNAPIASLTGTIAAATVNALSAGSYSVSIHARDALGNWGAFSTVALVVDKTGPATSAVSVSPNPNNGTTGYNSSVGAVRLFATFSDGATPIATGEGFIDTLGAPGAGFPLMPTDGLFNGGTEGGYADISLPNISLLTSGNHTFYVRGKDAAGNWGATVTTVLLIDKTAPTFTVAASVAPNPTLGATSVTLTAAASDPLNGSAPASNIVAAEYYIDTDPGIGSATALTVAAPAPALSLSAPISVSALPVGTHTIGLRVRDAANNWSLASTTTFSVVPDAIFANGFETGARPWGWSLASTSTTSRLNVTSGSPTLVGTYKLQAQGNAANYVQYNFGTAANPGTATFDARFHFNPNNNASTGQDIFAARNSTTTVFRVRYRRSGSQPQVQIQVGTTTNANWININNNASNRIEVVWQSGGTLVLYVNGSVASQTLSATANSISSVQLGSITSGGSNTLEYFDAFASKRSVATLIGP
jgi:FtsP/CotA-like multicopper oxidase with cupredoxin domain